MPKGSVAAGFYALAYDMTGMANGGAFADGETVIAFRGTNFVLNPSFFQSPAWDDIINGWTVSAGGTGFSGFSSIAGRQARLAIEFYRAVTQSLGSSDPRSPNITSTGHSLGGGLAGFVSGLYLQSATIFDDMPFQSAIDRIEESTSPIVQNAVYGGLQPWASGLSGINALATSGEVLDVTVRNILGTIQAREIESGYSSGSLINGLVELHSMALLTSLLWAEDNANSILNWNYAADNLWSAFFASDLANKMPGINIFVGPAGDNLSALQSAIAYSAIDEGVRPFGDTGIRAMFDDAADFGAALRYDFMPGWAGQRVNDAVGRVIVEFAGLLALRDVEAEALGGNAANATGGVIRLDIPGGQPDEQNFATGMRIDFGAAHWALGGPLHQSRQREYLVNTLMEQANADTELTRLSAWYRSLSPDTLLHDIDEVRFAFDNSAGAAPTDTDGLLLEVASNDNAAPVRIAA